MATCDIQALLDQAGCFSCLEPQQQAAIRLQLLCEILNNGGGGGGGVPPTRLINTTAPLTGGGDLSANRTIGIPQATSLADGYLAAADWATFNGKVGGSGTANRLAKFTAGTTLGDSIISDDGTDATVSGRLRFSGTTHGGLVLNNLTTAQRDAIAAPLAGSLIWNTATTRANVYTGSAWTSGWVRLEGDTMTGALGITQGTITANAPILDLSTTFNNAGVAFTGLRYNVTDTASATSSFLLDLQVGGSSQFNVRKDSVAVCSIFRTPSGGSFQWQSGSTQLYSDAAGALDLRRLTNPQTFNIYNTFTSSTNHERGFLSWVSNEFRIGTEKGSGGGSARDIGIYRDGTRIVQLTALDATFAGLNINAGNALQAASSSSIRWNSRSAMQSPANGIIALYNAALSDFDRLQFGGTTSSFPAIKRNAATLECKLADDSAFAMFASEFMSITDGITAPAAVAGRARIYVDTTDGDLKVVFGDGTVKTIVTDT